MAKILGTKSFEYRVIGQVPPGVSDEIATAEILRAVSWAGGILSAIASQQVIFHDDTPQQVGALLNERGKPRLS